MTKSVTYAVPLIIRLMMLGNLIGPIIFTFAWIILGFLSPGYTIWDTVIASYSPISQPISGLGLGLTAPFMNTAFIVLGILLIAGVFSVFSSIREISSFKRWCYALFLSLPGLGTIIDGCFNLESFLLHFAGFLLVLTSIVSFLVIGNMFRKIQRWQRFGKWLIFGSPLTLILSILYFATFDQIEAGQGYGIAGLTQRILVVEILTWFSIMGWIAFHQNHESHAQ